MAPRVAVLVPWSPGDPDREAAWANVQARLAAAHPDWEVHEGHPPPGPWCKAAAVHDALERTDADTLVIHDADVWCDHTAAAVAALDTHRWAIPHGNVYRLARGQLEPTTRRACLDRIPYLGYAGGGITALRRSTYEACPLDPRFVGWGQEDESWAGALSVLHGDPWRGIAPLFHWWHPPQDRVNLREGNPASVALCRRYQHAARQPSPEAMAELIEEARQWSSSSTTPASPPS